MSEPVLPGDGGGRRGLLRQSGITGVFAGIAIVSGLLLDVVIATRFGAGRATDSFFVAARLPLGVVQMLLVGANQTLVPTVSTWLVRHGVHRTARLTWDTAVLFAGLGILVAAIGAAVARPLVEVTAPGFDATEVNLAVDLLRVMFLVVPLVAVAEVLRAFMNARYAFVAPAAMNVVMNGVAAGIVIVSDGSIHALPWAYVAGAGAQVLFMLVAAHRHGFRVSPSLSSDPEAIAAVRLCARPLAGAGLNPLARVGEQAIVSFLPSGSVTVLNYATRLISAVGGSVFFRSVIVAIVPRMSEASARGEDERVASLTTFSVKLMVAISLPLTALVAVLAQPGAVILFDRGSFSRADAELLGLVLGVMSASLVGMGVQRALLAPFYARLDTRTPFRNTVYGVVANLALLPVLVVPFRSDERVALVMVAVVFSLSQYVNVVHAWIRLRSTLPVRLVGLRSFSYTVIAGSGGGAAAMVLVAIGLGLYGTHDRLATALAAAATAAVGLLPIGAAWKAVSRNGGMRSVTA